MGKKDSDRGVTRSRPPKIKGTGCLSPAVQGEKSNLVLQAVTTVRSVVLIVTEPVLYAGSARKGASSAQDFQELCSDL
jgi:hypothetical protein